MNRNIEELIQKILTDPKLGGDSQSGVYRDEPIIIPASKLPNFTPPEYRAMRKIAYEGDVFISDSAVFYKQAKFMEEYCDDYESKSDFATYYPTYRTMNDAQLRTYFSWRTRVRGGKVEKTSLSYVFVYIYELLNQIGSDSPLQSFEKLVSFWRDYREHDERINRYMEKWLADYVVYYGLDCSLLNGVLPPDPDEAVLVLYKYRDYGEDEIFNALNAFSSYDLRKSGFYKRYPEDVKAVTVRVFAELSDYFEKHRKSDICTRLFGQVYTDPYMMFSSAVFYEPHTHADTVYKFNPICTYTCKNGAWSCTRFFKHRNKKETGTLLKAVDCKLRRRYDYKQAIKPVQTSKLYSETIDKVIEDYLKEKQLKSRPVVKLDLSRLDGIRTASEQIRVRLLADELQDEPELEVLEREEPVVLMPAGEQPRDCGEQGCDKAGLNDTEYEFVRCLLYGGDYAGLVHAAGAMMSMITDSINEKMFDSFGDTVIEYDGDTPRIIEDYSEQLKGIIGQ